MKIAVLSGKGGTGKTFASVNLASVALSSTYLDCDVEEPNGRLFFEPTNLPVEEVSVLLPKVDRQKCDGCRKCIDFCKFNALAYVGGRVKVFHEVCHSCGGCAMVCPMEAITESGSLVGHIEIGKHNQVTVVTGILNVGEASGIPVIKKVLTRADENNLTIIDCPPGSACSVLESIEMADYCIIVAEPTLFGIHNFLMVDELVRLLKKPYGVIINKVENTENCMEQLCKEHEIPLLAQIPYNERLVKLTSNGRIVTESEEEIAKLFKGLLEQIRLEVRG